MLSIQEIQAAVEELLGGRFPGEAVYKNLVPADFTRPSFLVACGPVKMTDAGYASLDVTATVTITAFVVVDEYHNSQVEELAMRMMAVLELFAVGYLQVNDRALHVTGTEGDYEADCATVKVSLSYMDDRPGEETWQTMGQVNTTIQTN